MMLSGQTGGSSRLLKPTAASQDVQLLELLAARSAKISEILKESSQEGLSHFLQDMPAEAKTFDLVIKFCYGYELDLSTENVVPVTCLAFHLKMTESHSRNNLLRKALTFFEQRVLLSWNETIKALCTVENIYKQAVNYGLVDACIESLVAKALADPSLLGEPIKNSICADDREDADIVYRTNARRRLFDLEGQSEDLTVLPLLLYESIILAMNKRVVPPKNVAVSLSAYANKWVVSSISTGREKMSIYKRNSEREVIEAVERLLSHERGILSCTVLFDMLRSAIILEASSDCINGFEVRIGKQLEEATVKDLFIPFQGNSKEDIECLREILKTFYGNYTHSNLSGLIAVAELMERFLAEVSSNIDLKPEEFVSLADILIAASLVTQRRSDGIYRAIDIYLLNHRYLTESEREEVCLVLDCQKMSPEAREHAARNERLPLRVVVQVLFVGQLQLRDTFLGETQDSDNKLRKEVGGDDLEKLDCGEEQVRNEMEKMSHKVMELERECCMMRKEIQSGCSQSVKKEKVGMWREMKRKFGCTTSMHDYNCQIKKKKVHPK
ncbi:BTB/POZ domain-containing protein At3g03510 [Juglans microcarpa x Juglans regia]|uniref:BTB/POZ domain-containing protein At3g03510 n=1 Tax=Juglans microcarpa x Juglans regia TaxID=2249226 RepID=UPI001B7E7D59|nr:BTB/POZ domain-containing protein At3g03510 [Juglans microcarpa x Juglans regia]